MTASAVAPLPYPLLSTITTVGFVLYPYPPLVTSTEKIEPFAPTIGTALAPIPSPPTILTIGGIQLGYLIPIGNGIISSCVVGFVTF